MVLDFDWSAYYRRGGVHKHSQSSVIFGYRNPSNHLSSKRIIIAVPFPDYRQFFLFLIVTLLPPQFPFSVIFLPFDHC